MIQKVLQPLQGHPLRLEVQLSECRGISTFVGSSQDFGSSRYGSWYNSLGAGVSQLLQGHLKLLDLQDIGLGTTL